MCGLFGMAGPGISNDDLRFIKNLAWVSGLRGLDGTGLIQGRAYKHHAKVFSTKMKEEVGYFLSFHSYFKDGNKKVFNDVTDNLFIGHVRAATVGSVTDANAHPFEFDSLIGCHNGTLWDKKYDHKVKTDSEMMFEDIDTRGITDVLSELDKNSAYAITLYNKHTHKISIARNKERPLIYGINTKRSVIYWASELDMLKLCAHRNNISIKDYYIFEEDCIYTFLPTDVNLNRLPDWSKTSLSQLKPKKKSQGNVVPITSNKKAENNLLVLRSNQVSKYRKHCIECGVEMSLVDQYFGKEREVLGQIEFLCVLCGEKTPLKSHIIH